MLPCRYNFIKFLLHFRYISSSEVVIPSKQPCPLHFTRTKQGSEEIEEITKLLVFNDNWFQLSSMRFNVVFNEIQWNKSQCATSSESYVKLILSILDDLTTPLQQDCNIKVKGFTDSNLIYQFNHQSQIILFMLDELTNPLQLDCSLWVMGVTDSNSLFDQFCHSKQISVNICQNFWIISLTILQI